MGRIQHIAVAPMDPRRFQSVLSDGDYGALLQLIDTGTRALHGRVWNVNSTAKGGGVVEMLRPLVGYARGGGVDARWVVISGDPEFFAVTKRLHNHLHGFSGDEGPLGPDERAVYERTLDAHASELAAMLSPEDIVILHDPQTAGLIAAVRRTGAIAIWRCHVGLDQPNECARKAWSFLQAYVEQADAYVFSRRAFAWEGLDERKICVIQPSIDVFAAKNGSQSAEQSLAILAQSGIAPHENEHAPTFERSDGSPARVDRRAEIVEVAPLTPEDDLVTQVSRWDRLKDPLGVLHGFVEHVAEHVHAHLVLAGPSTASVADDPEGAAVLSTITEAWHALPEAVRRLVHLVSLPMEDIEENAAIVNALQRHSRVVVQKSLAEGFGLTVAEAMWKERPVVASRIGGIQDQIVHPDSGLLIGDPHDLREFGAAVVGLLREPERAERIGLAARTRVAEHFLGPHHLQRYFELFQDLLGARQ